MPRLVPVFLLLSTLAACSRDEPRAQTEPAVAEEENVLPAQMPQPALTPAESAAAVAKVAAHGDSVTEAVRGEPVATRPHVERVQDELALCRTQAEQAEGAIREHLKAACERIEARATKN